MINVYHKHLKVILSDNKKNIINFLFYVRDEIWNSKKTGPNILGYLKL